MIMNYQDPLLELMSQECVEASCLEEDPEEEDLMDSESANGGKETPSQVHIDPRTKNLKELPIQANFMGESKECATNSRCGLDPAVNAEYTRHLFKQCLVNES